MKNIFLFVGAIVGAAFVIAGVVAIGRGDRTGWLYLLLALFCFALAIMPGERIRDFVRRRPDV